MAVMQRAHRRYQRDRTALGSQIHNSFAQIGEGSGDTHARELVLAAIRGQHGAEAWETGMKLAGQIALVTGGSRGIGRATALAFAEQGADIAFCHLNDGPKADETAAE